MADMTRRVYDKLSGDMRDIKLIDNGDGTYSEQVVVTNDSFVDYIFTVAQNQSESAEVNLLGGNVLAIFPANAVEATTTNLSLKTGRVAGTRGVIRDTFNTRKTIPFTVACPIMVPADEYKGLTYTSLVLETAAGVAVAQATAARTFIVRVGHVWKA